MISKILRKNTSGARLAGFVLSNFIGLVIVLGGLQFYLDAASIWNDSDSIVNSDYLVINKKVTSGNLLGGNDSGFSDSEIADLRRQPWVRNVGLFTSSDYRVLASIEGGRNGGRGMSTYMFFESIPDDFVDVSGSEWYYRPGSDEVPIILSKDYLTLYNFGFASSAGLPQLSEGLMSSIPLKLRLTSEDGTRTRTFNGRVAGFSNRLNTILVPLKFMEETNAELGGGEKRLPSRLIIDVSSPGDVAISDYLSAHDWETAGDKSASSATFLLRVIVGIVLAIGGVITILSLFILLLSISLIMEKNRDKLHSLLMLGYELREVGRPYAVIAITVPLVALALALIATLCMRSFYMTPLSGLGARPAGIWAVLATGLIMTIIIIAINLLTISRRVRASFYTSRH